MSTKKANMLRRAALLVTFLALAILSGPSGVLAETCCQAPTVGDLDASRDVDIADVSIMIDHLFLTLTPLICKDEGNFNYPGGWYASPDTTIDITDLQIMIEGQFITMGPYPPCPSYQGEPEGSLLWRSGCGGGMAAATADFYPSDQSCIEWDYYAAGGYLNLTHVNAGFNCCPTLDISVDIEAGTITLHEVETLGECDCLCLYELSFGVANLSPGIYHVIAEEPYVKGDMEPLDFTIDLTETPNGEHCVTRTVYPWGDL